MSSQVLSCTRSNLKFDHVFELKLDTVVCEILT